MAINYARPANVRIVLFTLDGVQLDAMASDVGEQRSYIRLAKQNLKPIIRGAAPQPGAVLVIDLERQTVDTLWGPRGPHPAITKAIGAWRRTMRL